MKSKLTIKRNPRTNCWENSRTGVEFCAHFMRLIGCRNSKSKYRIEFQTEPEKGYRPVRLIPNRHCGFWYWQLETGDEVEQMPRVFLDRVDWYLKKKFRMEWLANKSFTIYFRIIKAN